MAKNPQEARSEQEDTPIQAQVKPAKNLQAAAAEQAPGASQSQVRVDTSELKSTYCNVCNATSTREEVVLNFGINHDWDLAGQGRSIQLQHRIILSPFAAKRLRDVFDSLVKEYEVRYGELK
jgi:hypothetical protein